MMVNSGVYATLGVVGVGMIIAVIAVLTCFVFNKCSKYGKSRQHIEAQLNIRPNRGPGNARRDQVQSGNTCETRTLKDSVLLGDAPPTYQMATEYPRVYAGQYYIGMSGGDELMASAYDSDNNLRQPPDYHFVNPQVS